VTSLSERTAIVTLALGLALAQVPAALALRGDVDGNGVVDDRDAQLVLDAVVGTRSLTSAERAAADVDGDGDVDVADAQLIRQAITRPGGK
jgi:hypothetical protein